MYVFFCIYIVYEIGYLWSYSVWMYLYDYFLCVLWIKINFLNWNKKYFGFVIKKNYYIIVKWYKEIYVVFDNIF